MAAKTVYAQEAVLNAILRGSVGTFPTTVYLALFTTAPTDAYTSGSPTGVEVSGGSYARQAVTFGAPSSSPSISASTALVTFPTASAGWGTIVAGGLFDASSGGNLWDWANLTSSVTVTTGNVIQFNVGNVTVTEN